MKLGLFILLFFSYFTLLSQSSFLQSGPMVGHAEVKSVQLWVQTTDAAKVHFNFWEKEAGKSKMRTSNSLETKAEEAFTAKVKLTKLTPGKTYQYQLFINDQAIELPYATTFQTQALWKYRSDPPDFKIAIGSCTFINEKAADRPGRPYGSDYKIFNSILKQTPDAMLWLGDNIYLRAREWNTQEGVFHRYTHTRSTKDMQAFLASVHHYAIWDDHDFGPNDSDRSFIHKDKTLKAFELFWANPSTGIPQVEGSITTQFSWGDVDFFLLDNRSFKSPNNCKTCEPSILGEAQLNWLIEALTASTASFKMIAIGGQVLNTAAQYENYVHHHKKERDLLLERIEKEGLKNVIFLSGDRHHTELSKLTNGAGNTLYDVTVSPLTSGVGNNQNERNENRVENTLVRAHNYGILAFSGSKNDRQLEVSIFNQDNELLWTHLIAAE